MQRSAQHERRNQTAPDKISKRSHLHRRLPAEACGDDAAPSTGTRHAEVTQALVEACGFSAEGENVMLQVAVLILALIPATVCVCISGYLAMNGLGGWGWFLFVGLLLSNISFNSKEEGED